MDVNARKNELLDVASDAKPIVLGVDPVLVMAEREKVSMQATNAGHHNITLYVYGETESVAKSTKKRQDPHLLERTQPAMSGVVHSPTTQHLIPS